MSGRHAQRHQILGRVWIAALLGPAEGGFGGVDSPLLGEQHAQVARGRGMPESIGAIVGARRPSPVVPFLQEDGEIECTVRIVTLRGAPIRGLGARHVPPTLQQDAQVACGSGVAGRVGPPIRRLGFGQIVAALQLQAQAKLALRERAAVICRSVRADGDPAQAL